MTNEQTPEEIEQTQKLQKKFYAFQLLEEETKSLYNQLVKFDEQLISITNIQNDLETFSKTKVDTEMLVPVANGIFAKAKVVDTKEFIVNVGSGVAVNKNVDDTKKLLETQAIEIQNYKVQLSAQIQLNTIKLQDYEKDLAVLIK